MTFERVSVILPVYNGARYLAEAMHSVLTQTTLPDELIVVDDGSTDDSAAIVSSLSAASSVLIRIMHQANQGPAAARNIGLSLAACDLIAFQDADDLWMPDKLVHQVALMQRHSDVQAVIGYTQLAFEQPFQPDERERPLDRLGLILLLQASLFRRTLFEHIGGFDPALRGDEDIEWFLRLLEHPIKILVHPDPVAIYRRHDANLTRNLQRSRQQLALALHRALDRRRQDQNNTGRIATLSFVPAISE